MLLPLQLNLESSAGDTTLAASLSCSAMLSASLLTDITFAAQLTGSGTLTGLLGDSIEIPASATWPSLLPTQVQQDGFAELQPQSAAIRTPNDIGPEKQRSRYSTLNLPFQGVFILTSEQCDTFWTFYRIVLGNGALKFDGLPHLRTGAAVNHRFNVSSPPQAKALGGDNYALSVVLEVVP